MHVKEGDSGASADASADELVIEGSGNSGLSILSGSSDYGTILFSDSGDSAAGRMRYEHNNNALNFGTNGAWDRMYINSSGNVGIGTASPEERLHVLGQAVFDNIGNTNRGNIIMGAQGSGTSKWATLAATHYNEATGSGNGSGNAGVMVIGSESAASYNKIWIGHGPYELNPATQINFGTHSATTHNLGGTTHMVIDSAGAVGIGTTSPASKLHIRTSTNNNYEFEEVSGELSFSALNDARSANVPLQFAASEFNFISGNVGIGTSSPNTPLSLIHI